MRTFLTHTAQIKKVLSAKETVLSRTLWHSGRTWKSKSMDDLHGSTPGTGATPGANVPMFDVLMEMLPKATLIEEVLYSRTLPGGLDAAPFHLQLPRHRVSVWSLHII